MTSSHREALFDFEDLFVLDLANNHQGDIEHGKRVIREHGAVVARHGVRGVIKFQFRNLDTFIHPNHLESSDNKHVPRFLSTRLNRDGFQALLDEVRRQGLLAACTPFDEASVDLIEEMGFDIIKVASCSARDWPLLERIAASARPVIASTGGLLQADMDALVSFLGHRGADFALMHCVSVYPTPDFMCHLNNIATMIERFGGLTVGWSTHEDPADTMPIGLALAKGARMFERHVGVPTDTIKLNAYSSDPNQIDAWIAAWKKANTLLGLEERQPPSEDEAVAIAGLSRGVFARHELEAGHAVTREDVYFAFPYAHGGLESGQWRSGIVTTKPIKADAALAFDSIDMPARSEVQVLKQAVHEVKALLNKARVHLGSEFEVEYSHHYGPGTFRETGVVIINCINREYCKKVLIQLAGQGHPSHYHKRKEETFHVLWGELHSELDGRHRLLQPGDTLLVLPGVWHRFWTETGCVFEEISTTHYNNDSVYRDPKIQAMKRAERKTVVDHWGRFQLADGAYATE